MLRHRYAPSSFRLSVVTPVLKNKLGSVNDSENYRGIALSSIFAKLFDIVIINSHRKYFDSSDLQFGFKENSSTAQCTFVFNEVEQYYINNGANVLQPS